MVEKIYTFIYNINMKKLLLLHNNPENLIHGGDIWYFSNWGKRGM